jgi:integrase
MGTIPKKSWKMDGCKGSFFVRGKNSIIWYRRSRHERFTTKLPYTPKNRLLAAKKIREEENRGFADSEIRTIGEALEYYKESTMLKKGDSTREAYQFLFDRMLPDKDRLITDFKYIESRINLVKTSGYARHTIFNYFTALSALFNFLVKRKIVKESPLSRDDYPKLKSKVVDVYSDTELERIFNYFRVENYEMYLFLKFLYKTAFRYNEAAKLKVSDIIINDQYRNNIILHKSKYGDKAENFPLTDAIIELFEEIKGLSKKKPNQYVWDIGTKKKSYANDMLNKALKELDIPKKSSDYQGKGRLFHTFRKTRITKWIQKGISVHGLEKLSRDSYATVRKYYDAVDTDDYSDFVD